jgi:hypothetical protein
MTRHRWVMTCSTAMMALAAGTVLALQTAAGAQGRDTTPPKVTFNQDDRQKTLAWYETHQKDLPAGFRESDRLAPPLEQQLKEGAVLDRTLQGQVHPVPTDLLHVLAPPPGVYRYAIVGRHLVLINDSYKVFDVIHLGHVR